ncbi:uncharacterized protein VTP21DRAFT_404 [Calcarisporiella thermophila]|uniref:uncharacterized protein n=1 Tax=Calcarisporiella thermophila TaxID=911321 RepID=UPI003743EF92
MAVVSVKFILRNKARRISLDTENTTWEQLKEKLRTLFPLVTNPTLQYHDHDGDIISLDTTEELREALATNITRFYLVSSDSEGWDFVAAGAQTPRTEVTENFVTPAPEQERAEGESNVNAGDSEKGKYRAVTVEDVAEDNATPMETEGVAANPQEEGSSTGEAKNSASQGEGQSTQEGEPPFVKLAREVEGLAERFRDLLDQNPEIIERINSIMNHVAENIAVNFDVQNLEHWLQSLQNNEQYRQFGGFGGFGGPWWGRRGCHGWQRGCGDTYFNQGRRFSPGSANCGYGRFGATGSQHQQQQQQTANFEQEIDELVKQLHAMGFYGETDLEDLLRRYHGNVPRVVEVLVNRRNEAEKQRESGEKSQ